MTDFIPQTELQNEGGRFCYNLEQKEKIPERYWQLFELLPFEGAIYLDLPEHSGPLRNAFMKIGGMIISFRGITFLQKGVNPKNTEVPYYSNDMTSPTRIEMRCPDLNNMPTSYVIHPSDCKSVIFSPYIPEVYPEGEEGLMNPFYDFLEDIYTDKFNKGEI